MTECRRGTGCRAHGWTLSTRVHGLDQLIAKASQPAWLRAAGIAVLVAVTTYCALDAVWNPVASAVVVDAVLERQPPEKGQALDFNRVRQELAGDDALREALQSAG